MRRPSLFLFALTLLGCRAESPVGGFPAGTWIDLSHDFSSETIYWPTARPFSLDVVSAERTPGGYYYAANDFSAAEHGGTHLDAPVHFAEGRHTSDQVPLDRLIGPAAVVDVAERVGADPDYQLDVAELEQWEATHGSVRQGIILLIRTGWSDRWPDKARYLGTTRTGPDAVADLHFPGIDSAAGEWLVDRKVKAVGIDTPSIDRGQSTTFMAHRILLGENIPAFENVTQLDRLPPTGSFVVALPMKIRGGSGGPLRIVALVPDAAPSNTSTPNSSHAE
ncbi:MAG: cyclase family protein [Gemmatimonadales bacterium]|nr:cyclase family protein [Gemmatimonadales bacterium]MBA3553229.1 cyclase family protein [Gemmatimonadales bacterium]